MKKLLIGLLAIGSFSSFAEKSSGECLLDPTVSGNMFRSKFNSKQRKVLNEKGYKVLKQLELSKIRNRGFEKQVFKLHFGFPFSHMSYYLPRLIINGHQINADRKIFKKLKEARDYSTSCVVIHSDNDEIILKIAALEKILANEELGAEREFSIYKEINDLKDSYDNSLDRRVCSYLDLNLETIPDCNEL